MTTEFWLGFVLGLLSLIGVSVALHVRSEKAKRRAFEREIAAIDGKYPVQQPAATKVAPPSCQRSGDGQHRWVDVTSLDRPPFSQWVCKHCSTPQDVVSLTVNTARVCIPTPNGELAFESILPGSTEHATVGDVRYVVHRAEQLRKDVH
jgi:hypothetical protein